jgi:glyoxylase-like metal-dependent hydrolase (beta-lactamase superfamily II)
MLPSFNSLPVLKSARRACGLLVALAGLGGIWGGAHGAAPQLQIQVPGNYSLMLGDFQITALSDGVFGLDTGAMLNNTTARTRELLADSFHGGIVTTSVNAYLVNTGERLILVDTGAAQLFGATLGKLLVNLAASGWRPEQIDTVLITHLHPDHVGGLLAAGQVAFPNATVFADQREAGFWLSEVEYRKAPETRKAFFEGAAAAIRPYAANDKFRTFAAPVELLPGVRALPAPGHTPGHTVYAIESKGHKLVFWGDLTEIASVQFAEPGVTMGFDSDGPGSARERTRAYADAARGRYLVAGAHLPFPGLGHVRADRGTYVWVPLDYGAPP